MEVSLQKKMAISFNTYRRIYRWLSQVSLSFRTNAHKWLTAEEKLLLKSLSSSTHNLAYLRNLTTHINTKTLVGFPCMTNTRKKRFCIRFDLFSCYEKNKQQKKYVQNDSPKSYTIAQPCQLRSNCIPDLKLKIYCEFLITDLPIITCGTAK